MALALIGTRPRLFVFGVPSLPLAFLRGGGVRFSERGGLPLVRFPERGIPSSP